MTADDIAQLIRDGLPGAQVEVLGDDGAHFQARVIDPAFAGESVVARHRRVYAALGARMGKEIHALALKTLTPDEAAA